VDFHLVTSTLVQDFESSEIQYAVIGGFALGLWGATRATIDIDFLLLIEDVGKVEAILKKYAYQCVYKTENVGQYVSDNNEYGSVDFIFSSREISRKMLSRSIDTELLSSRRIKVLMPEDIIGLKIQALSNDPARKSKDLADIEALLSARQSDGIDWQLLKEYFDLFDKSELYQSMENQYGNVK
jgi:hypothetical protein